jgi:ATPase subunit of ABC transporter with duplicated ATPase domains
MLTTQTRMQEKIRAVVQFEEMDGWNADSAAASLLSQFRIGEEYHYTLMQDMDNKLKVRVLLTQAYLAIQMC